MSNLFDGGGGGGGGGSIPNSPAPAPTEPASAPRTRRMPTSRDTLLTEASRRTRGAALRRRGRASTILTDRDEGDQIGSGGHSLGN